ncbi:reverse transcriptase domain-containing protein, partial [Tanacetum coccineum]
VHHDTSQANMEDAIEPIVDTTAEIAAEPIISPSHANQTVKGRLEEYEETMQGMYEHFLEIPLPKIDRIEEDVQTLRDRLVASEGVNTNLRERVRSLELSELSLRDSLRTARAERVEMQFQVRHTTEQLQQCQIAHYHDSARIKRLEAFLCRHFGYRITIPVKRRGLTTAAIERLVNQRVADALAAQEANQNNENGGGNGNMNKAGNRNEENGDVGGVTPVARAYTYIDFLNCQPRNFSGTEGVIVKFATFTLLNGALTWWNSHVQTIGIDEAYEMSWKDLMKLMIKFFCPRNEIEKLESELWNLSVKETDVAGYT